MDVLCHSAPSFHKTEKTASGGLHVRKCWKIIKAGKGQV